jgi:hypothetical protein
MMVAYVQHRAVKGCSSIVLWHLSPNINGFFRLFHGHRVEFRAFNYLRPAITISYFPVVAFPCHILEMLDWTTVRNSSVVINLRQGGVR